MKQNNLDAQLHNIIVGSVRTEVNLEDGGETRRGRERGVCVRGRETEKERERILVGGATCKRIYTRHTLQLCVCKIR